MKVLMICQTDLSSKDSLGVTKKILGQYKAFKNLGCDTWLACMEGGKAVLWHDSKKIVLVKEQWKSYITVCKLFSLMPIIAKKYDIEMCYIRYPLADWAFMRMIKGLHKVCKIVVEIPTYPYDEQNNTNHNPVARFNIFQDKINRDRMKQYVDLISTFSDDKAIFGIPCINISNGIDVTQIKYLGDKLKYEEDINIIGVARIQRDHGYDRLIRGMKDYYDSSNKNKRNICFHIVGSGDAEVELRELANRYGLGDKVLFHGTKTGEDLEKIYLQCHIGAGLLAGFRSGHDTRSALKNREYCAVGIPFIGSTFDSAIPLNVSWYYLIENRDTAVPMQTIIDFFEYIKRSPEIHREMREIAESQFTWEKQLEKVIRIAVNK